MRIADPAPHSLDPARGSSSLRGSVTERAAQGRCDPVLLGVRHLREQRQDDRLVLRRLALPQAPTGAGSAIASARAAATRPRARRIGGFAVTAHDPPPAGYALVEQHLHHASLIAPRRQANAEALPVAPGPLRLAR